MCTVCTFLFNEEKLENIQHTWKMYNLIKISVKIFRKVTLNECWKEI